MTNNSAKPQVLVAFSSEDKLTLRNGVTYPTGYYLNEAAVPMMAMAQAGFELVIANPRGNAPAMDKHSDSDSYFGDSAAMLAAAKAFLSNLPGMQTPRTFASVLAEGLDGYTGFFAPGGHAPMQDLIKDKDLGQILRHFHAKQKPTALICHAPIALISTMDNAEAFVQALISGDTATAAAQAKNWPYADYWMTIFSTAEEQHAEGAQLGGNVLFYPDAALRTAGGKLKVLPPWSSNAVPWNELITGQNPFSDGALVKLLIPALQKAASR